MSRFIDPDDQWIVDMLLDKDITDRIPEPMFYFLIDFYFHRDPIEKIADFHGCSYWDAREKLVDAAELLETVGEKPGLDLEWMPVDNFYKKHQKLPRRTDQLRDEAIHVEIIRLRNFNQRPPGQRFMDRFRGRRPGDSPGNPPRR